MEWFKRQLESFPIYRKEFHLILVLSASVVCWFGSGTKMVLCQVENKARKRRQQIQATEHYIVYIVCSWVFINWNDGDCFKNYAIRGDKCCFQLSIINDFLCCFVNKYILEHLANILSYILYLHGLICKLNLNMVE